MEPRETFLIMLGLILADHNHILTLQTKKNNNWDKISKLLFER